MRKPKNIQDLTRWEALDLLGAAALLSTEKRWGSLCELLGLTEELADGLTMAECMECLNVRMVEIAKRAHITL